MDDAIGTARLLAGRYELTGVLGRGGMGEVWSATDRRLGREVAVKLLRPDLAGQPEVRRRFEHEGRAAAALSHPNIVAVFDTGEHDGVPFLVMERLAGATLADEIAAGPVPPERVQRVGEQVLAALNAAHEAGIIHRDVKPGNILVADDETWKVADFGIAKSAEGATTDLTATGALVGTVAYLSPERVSGSTATAVSDLYSVGVVLYEALSARKPFQAETPMGLADLIRSDRAPPLADVRPGVDPAIASVVERAMDKDPRVRFASAAEMADALRSGLPATTRALPVSATPTTRQHAAPRRPSGVRTAIIRLAAVALVVVALALAASRLAGDSGEGRPAGDPGPPSGKDAALPESFVDALEELEEAVRR